MSKNANEPAFPADWKDFQPTTGDQVVREQFFGLTKREYFAGKETLSDLDHPEAGITMTCCASLAGPRPQGDWSVEHLKWEAKWRAALKVIRADALIAALEEKK